MNGFPVLILEMCSSTQQEDERRMKLQAACLVRLGNALMQSPEYVTKAIYIDDDYRATEYTFFQKGREDLVLFPLLLNDKKLTIVIASR